MIAEMTSAADVATQLEQKGNRISQLEQQMAQMQRRLEWIFRKMRANNTDEQDEGGDALEDLANETLGKAE